MLAARTLAKASDEADASRPGALNVGGFRVDIASIRPLPNIILTKADRYSM